MNILYIGDIMGRPGVEVVEQVLPAVVQEYSVDLVIAQSENVTDGKGMSVADMKRLQVAGIDFFTGGNHTPRQPDIHPLLEDENQPVIGPTNMVDCPGRGWKAISTPKGQVLIVSLLGSTVGRGIETTNPLQAVDHILSLTQDQNYLATVVNFHGDYSSQKRIIGYYLDGRVAAVIGDHWHVPTADAAVLPGGTAHITDVGMCGTLHSSLGVTFEAVIPRWRDSIPTKNTIATQAPYQFNALLVAVDLMTGRARQAEHIQKIID